MKDKDRLNDNPTDRDDMVVPARVDKPGSEGMPGKDGKDEKPVFETQSGRSRGPDYTPPGKQDKVIDY